MKYTIKKNMTGYSVNYNCPNCDAGLRNPLKEAGIGDVCPDCGHAYTVPGERELLTHRQQQAKEKEVLEERRRQAKLERERMKQEQQRKREENAARVEQERAYQQQQAVRESEVKRGMSGIGFIPFSVLKPFTDLYYDSGNREAEVVAKRLRIVAESIIKIGTVFFFLDFAWVLVGCYLFITTPVGNAETIFQQIYIRASVLTLAATVVGWLLWWGARMCTAAILYALFSLVAASYKLTFTK